MIEFKFNIYIYIYIHTHTYKNNDVKNYETSKTNETKFQKVNQKYIAN